MKEFIITNDMASQRLDKFIKRQLPLCPSGLLYKQLRKKNITLNDGKATGSEIIKEGDSVKIWFSDETIEKFVSDKKTDISKYLAVYDKYKNSIEVIKESQEEGYIVFNKPAGILSQSDKSGDPSVNDYLIGYLFANNRITEESFKISKPSVCNRLDRNTSGLIFCSMDLKGVRYYDSNIKNGGDKYYLALVNGRFGKEGIFEDYVKKDAEDNKLIFVSKDDPDALYIKTGFELVRAADDISLVKAHLFTGRSHQIRAHLSHLGFPISGDPKYGNKNSSIKALRQMLHAYEIVSSENDNNIKLVAPLPDDMEKLCKKHFGPSEDYLK